MFFQPAAAVWLGLSPDVAGAWIGGNIDTTAAVVGAGTLHSQQALKVASITKISQNAGHRVQHGPGSGGGEPAVRVREAA